MEGKKITAEKKKNLFPFFLVSNWSAPGRTGGLSKSSIRRREIPGLALLFNTHHQAFRRPQKNFFGPFHEKRENNKRRNTTADTVVVWWPRRCWTASLWLIWSIFFHEPTRGFVKKESDAIPSRQCPHFSIPVDAVVNSPTSPLVSDSFFPPSFVCWRIERMEINLYASSLFLLIYSWKTALNFLFFSSSIEWMNEWRIFLFLCDTTMSSVFLLPFRWIALEKVHCFFKWFSPLVFDALNEPPKCAPSFFFPITLWQSSLLFPPKRKKKKRKKKKELQEEEWLCGFWFLLPHHQLPSALGCVLDSSARWLCRSAWHRAERKIGGWLVWSESQKPHRRNKRRNVCIHTERPERVA